VTLRRAVSARGGHLQAVGRLLAACGLLAGCGGQAGRSTGAGPGQASHFARVPDGDWPTFDYNAHRSGVGPNRTGITRANLGKLKTRVVPINGVADSSPIQAHGLKIHGRRHDVDFVTTTYGRTIAFEPGTGARLWEYAPRAVGDLQGSHQITTATPVLDPNRRYVYAATPTGFIHKLAIATGHQVWKARVTWDATREKIEGGLNVSGRYVIAATGGYIGDAPVYQGHVALIDRRNGHLVRVWNSLCSNRHHLIHPPGSCPASDSAIWARAGAVVEPGSRRLLVATGNGPFNGHTNWGDSVLELNPDASRLLHNWTPNNQAQLNSSDLDLGATAPAILPGTSLAVQGGKAPKLTLLDLKRLDGTRGGADSKTGVQLQTLAAPASVYTAPVAFRQGGHDYVVVATYQAIAGYKLSRGRLHQIWLQHVGGSSPVIAGGPMFVYDPGGGRLRVMNPVSGKVLSSLAAASGHWSSPIVVGGRIVLPVGGSVSDNATSGEVLVYYLPGR
jgi:hypothetical protein